MKSRSIQRRFACLIALAACAILVIAGLPHGQPTTAKEPPADAHAEKFTAVVQPLLKKYCLACHSTKAKKGSLDLERFDSVAQVRKGLKPWQQTIEMLETGEMPPKEKPQPTADERKQLVAWIRTFLDTEARVTSGDLHDGTLLLRAGKKRFSRVAAG